MFFILSKVLHFAVKPLLWIFFAGLFGAWKKRGNRRYWIGFILFSYLISNQFLVDLIFRTWEPDPIKIEELSDNYSGIILLGGYSSYFEEADRPIFRSASDRFAQTIMLTRGKNISPVIVTGGSGNIYKPDEKEAIFIERFLKDCKLDTGQFFYDAESRNTAQNASNTLKLIQENSLSTDNWLLVTSAFHMRRSAGCYKKVGINFTAFPVDHKAGPPKPQFEYLLMPSVDAFHKWELLFHEWTGYLAYKITGKI